MGMAIFYLAIFVWSFASWRTLEIFRPTTIMSNRAKVGLYKRVLVFIVTAASAAIVASTTAPDKISHNVFGAVAFFDLLLAVLFDYLCYRPLKKLAS